MSSNLIGLKKSKHLQIRQFLNTREINLNEFQIYMNWEIFNIKYLVLMFVC